MPNTKAIFLDRDGTITYGVPRYERVDSVDKVELLPNTLAGLKILQQLDYQFFIVTNQAGLAEGLISWEEFTAINQAVLQQIAPSGLMVTETYVCPHGEGSTCDCRKPKPGLLLQAASKYGIDLANSWMIGDRLSDIQAGQAAGTKTILVQTGTIQEAPDATFIATDLLAAANYIAAIKQ